MPKNERLIVAERNDPQSRLGAKVSYTWDVNMGSHQLKIKPQIKATWQHEYLNRATGVSAGFQGASGGPVGDFTVYGPSLGRDSAVLTAGLSVQWNPRMAVYAAYQGEVGRDNYSSNLITGGFQMSF